MTRSPADPYRPTGPTIEFGIDSPPGIPRTWACLECEGVRGLYDPDIGRHLREEHPGWGEAKVQER